MKCLLLKNGTECGADLSPTQDICGNCGGDVEIDERKTKKCPKCSKRLILTHHFCTGCRFSFEDVTKKITCEGKKEDGTKCNHELSPSDRFCSTCDIRLRKEDVLDRGNDQNQTDEKNKDQTEEKNKDQTEEINKDQNEEKNKDQTDELDGRDDENRPEQETEKQITETIENTTQKPILYVPSAEDGEPEKRGLAVVCSHSIFMQDSYKPSPRTSASDDHDMMKSLWDLYGCHVIDCIDEKSDFYETKLIEKIENELEKITNIGIFVFVLSSHGHESAEHILHLDGKKEFQHFFFTKDSQCSTQDLMNKIADIKQLKNKLKIFVIQACRSRTVAKDENEGRTAAKDENEDHGVGIGLEKGSDLSGGQNDGTVYPDAKGHMPHEDEKKNKPDDKRQDDGIDQSDAGGYMPQEDEFIIDLPPIEGVPHCDDCVVMFASMSGKYAYSKCNHLFYSGGWLIKSVDIILKKYEKGKRAHILDILVEINREVGTREAKVERDTCEIPNLDLEIKMENLQLGLKNHVNKLREIYSNHSSKVEISFCQDELIKLTAEIDQDGHTEVSLNKIKEETVQLTEKFKRELRYVTLKSQSNFFHNLAFDDKDLFLCRIK